MEGMHAPSRLIGGEQRREAEFRSEVDVKVKGEIL